MTTTYPGTADSFTNPTGTSTVDVVDHAAQHSNINDSMAAVQTTLGTTAGTSVLKNFAAGDFPVRATGGGATGTLQQTIVGGTLSSNIVNIATLGSPTITGGNINSGTLGTPVITGGNINSGTMGTPVINVGSDASGDVYYRNASNVFTRLAIGAAGGFLTTDGTTPSWTSSRFVTISFTRDLSTSSGTVSYTGVGFTAKAVVMIGVVNSAVKSSIGFTDTSNQYVIYERPSNGYSFETTNIASIDDGAGANQKAVIQNFGTNGFDLAWTKAGSPTGTAQFFALCFK